MQYILFHLGIIIILFLLSWPIYGFIHKISKSRSSVKGTTDCRNKISNEKWQLFKFRNEGFDTLFPCVPSITNHEEDKIKVFSGNDGKEIIYRISVAVFDPSCSLLDRPEYATLNILATGIMGNEEVEDFKKYDCDLSRHEGHNALDFYVIKKENKYYLKGRIILCGNVAYTLFVCSWVSNCDDKKYSKFVNSFKITKKAVPKET